MHLGACLRPCSCETISPVWESARVKENQGLRSRAPSLGPQQNHHRSLWRQSQWETLSTRPILSILRPVTVMSQDGCLLPKCPACRRDPRRLCTWTIVAGAQDLPKQIGLGVSERQAETIWLSEPRFNLPVVLGTRLALNQAYHDGSAIRRLGNCQVSPSWGGLARFTLDVVSLRSQTYL